MESRSLLGVSIIKVYFQPGTNADADVTELSNLALADLKRLPPAAWRMVGLCGSTASSWRVCIPWTVLRNSRGRISGRASRSQSGLRGKAREPVGRCLSQSKIPPGVPNRCVDALRLARGRHWSLCPQRQQRFPGGEVGRGFGSWAWVRRCWRVWACGGRLGHSCSSATCFLIIAGHSGAEPGRVRLAERCWAAWLLCL